MVRSSHKPMKTYSRRRMRSRQSHQDASQSSPLRPLSPGAQDVSFALMAQRMNKRARLAAQPSTTSPVDAGPFREFFSQDRDGRPSKRTKSLPSDRLQVPLGVDPVRSDYMLDDLTHPPPQLSTPLQAMPYDHTMSLSSVSHSALTLEQLSPLPVAKRILSRTSSRNFKENAGHRGSRSLASPFSSRPGSRAPSPGKTTRKRLGQHIKSRTLSQSGTLREKIVDQNLLSLRTMQDALPSSDVTAGVLYSPSRPNSSTHARASSIPTLKPALDQISSEAWLVPPKALSRPTSMTDFDTEGDRPHAEASEHSSFLRDAPVQVSTPPRRQRSATIGVWAHGLMPQIDADPPPPVRSFRYDSEVDISDSSRPGSPTESRSKRVNPPRRRRRTIVHLPSDSLFSSSLDFSALMSETERFPRPPASEGSRSPELNLLSRNSDLAPAFSLRNSPAEQMCKASSDRHKTFASLGFSGPSSPAPTADEHGRRLPAPPPASPIADASLSDVKAAIDGDELLDLFSVLGLDEDEKWNAICNVDDSGVAFPGPEARISPPSKGGRVRRKRGDTIRASDFAKIPMSASFEGCASSGLASGQRIQPRRTRSGTITQASSSGGGKRKHEGWPTIKMRTTEEPLSVHGDDADDELLLKDGDFVD